MRLKSLARELVPPIVLKTLRRPANPATATGDHPRLSSRTYQIEFTRVDIGGAAYFVPAYGRDRPAARSILRGDFYEPLTHALVGLLLAARPGDMVHAGTFFGDMLPSFSRKCPGAVYAFEPVLESYVLAKQSVEQNRLTNVVLFNAALGSTLSVAHVNTTRQDGSHRGGASHVADAGQPTATLPIDALGLRNLAVLQLDVEGHEIEALEGARNTIESARPFILVEDNARQCAEYLSNLGYRSGGAVPGLSLWAADEHLEQARSIHRKLA